MQNLKTETKENLKPMLQQQVQEILLLITAFSNLLLKETEALKKADFKTVDTLQEQKKSFAKQYAAKVNALAAHRAELPKLDLALREKLVKERARFNTVLSDNMRALELAQLSTKRLVNKILEVARAAVTDDNQTHYSKGGKAMTYKSASTSLSVDQNL